MQKSPRQRNRSIVPSNHIIRPCKTRVIIPKLLYTYLDETDQLHYHAYDGEKASYLVNTNLQSLCSNTAPSWEQQHHAASEQQSH